MNSPAFAELASLLLTPSTWAGSAWCGLALLLLLFAGAIVAAGRS